MTSDAQSATLRAAAGLAAARHLMVDEVEVPLTEDVRTHLRKLLTHLAAGDAVEVVALPELLTTQQAADRIGVSRPTLVKMLDDGVIPSSRPGVHRRVPRQGLQDFIDSLPQRRRDGLRDLAETFDPDVPDTFVATR